jgi:uncharacterized repeat protein (TIGR03806 family)
MGIVLRWIVVGSLLVLVCGCHSSGDDAAVTPPATQPPPPGAPVVGLDQRPTNLTCVAPAKGNSNAGTTIRLERVFANLTFNQPLAMLQAPGDNSRWFVVEKTGAVRVFDNVANPTASTFISLAVNASSEGGLLGMAFHPSYATNGRVYLSWTEGTPMVSTIARFTHTPGAATLPAGSRQNVIRVNQPYENHNGGQIEFGPDGYLYIGFGDGGAGGDPEGRGQDTTDLLGDFLRLDVEGTAPYAIPPDNPFAGGPMCTANSNVSANNCPEIYAWGFRNPWRWSFDSVSGTLWVGDVGQNTFEEIDQVRRGGNYGWNCREGAATYSASCGTSTGLIDPVHYYGRSLGGSVTGGYVYRGAALPALVGSYLFADYISGRIWRLVANGSGGFSAQELLDTSLSIASFGEGNDGELYVVDIVGGGLHRIVDGGGAAPPGPPVATLLSGTGCVIPQNPSQPASGLVPYHAAAPFWSDGAAKERWLAIPDGTTISVAADGDFTFPNGSVLMKHFRLNGNLVETRLFMRHPDGEWAGYTYEWNAQRTDATLVQGGKTVTIGDQSWIYPSGNECLACHTAAAGGALGLEIAQLNHDVTYASTNRTANQLRTLDHIVMFAAPLGDPSLRPTLVDPADASASLGARARAYLHTNCAHCHRPNGPTGVSMDLRFATALSATAACDAQPQAGDLGLANARLIAPGAPERSVLLERMSRRDAQAMPPLASNLVDAAGVGVIRDWIASLSSCM